MDYDCLLLNSNWRCLPTIFLDDNNVPVVLTCRNHDGGRKRMMIHTSRAVDHILPSMYADQLAHAVIQCRTVKPMRTTTYSTQFQLCEQRGSFAGIDTFSMTDFQNMEINSTLLAHYESLSIVHRKDINSLLTKLVEEKKLGSVLQTHVEKRLLIL